MKNFVITFLILGNISLLHAQPVDAEYSKQWWTKYEENSVGANLENAWMVAKQNYETRIAVIDSGYDYTHPDLKNNIEINKKEIPDNGIDDKNGFVDDYYGYNVTLKNGNIVPSKDHGTHVAGIIAAEHNQIGIAGTSRFAKLILVKINTMYRPTFPNEVAHGIDFAVSRGANVINISLGTKEFIDTPELRAAIKRAEQKMW